MSNREKYNREKYNRVFMEALDVTEEKLSGLSYQDVPAWDSVGHMGLISDLEDEFDIQIETDDIVDFNSYEKGIEILKKYDVIIE
ncbi:MAG: acyl carrier protein [Lachnospiraceae bacterium]|nr:acyl carrier protein [Lachnospiraceae bacterium]